ncbi:MAG: diacylglycerol kinase family protein [Xenococcaceae cyanobacterium MO_188.B29]|nr:diacylglycerol kinase family protein [Xenococcaceae cyanobacterium MO_188.B29]
MTKSDNSNAKTLSFIANTHPLMNNSINPVYPPQEKNLRNLAWKVAPTLLISFKYAWAGVRYAFITQRNFRIHTAVATLALSLGFYLQVSAMEMAVITITCAMVMILELINTAIESVVDLTVKQTYHELAKIAKDCAAGAVLLSAIAAVLVAGFILLPPLLRLILSVS